MPDNVGPITGRAGAEPRSTDRNYTAGPVRCIGGLCPPLADAVEPILIPLQEVSLRFGGRDANIRQHPHVSSLRSGDDQEPVLSAAVSTAWQYWIVRVDSPRAFSAL